MLNFSLFSITITLISFIIIVFLYRRYFSHVVKKSLLKKLIGGILAYIILPILINILTTYWYTNFSNESSKKGILKANIESAEKTLITAFSTTSNPISIRTKAAEGLGQIGKIEEVKQAWNNETEFFNTILTYDTASYQTENRQELNQQFILKLRNSIALKDTNKANLREDKKKLIVDNINTISIQLRNFREFINSEKLSEDEKKEVKEKNTIHNIDSLLSFLEKTTNKILPQKRYNFPGFIFDLQNTFADLIAGASVDNLKESDLLLLHFKSISQKLDALNKTYISPVPEKPVVAEYERIIDMLIKYGATDALVEFKKTASNKDYSIEVRDRSIFGIGEISDESDLGYLTELYSSENNEVIKLSLLGSIIRILRKTKLHK